MPIITIPQVDGGTRYVALSNTDAATVRRDSAMIDSVYPFGVLDCAADGTIHLGPTGPRWDTVKPTVRALLVKACETSDGDHND